MSQTVDEQVKIISATELWRDQKNKTMFRYACARVMDNVKVASEKGYRKTVFDPPAEMYGAVKAEFAKYGYKFRPTGIVGGVRQDSEDICW